MISLQLLLLVGGVTVDLPSEAEATGTRITLGEIAKVTAADTDAAILEAVRAVELGYMPAPGHSRMLMRWKLERAVAVMVPEAEVQWGGEAKCRVFPAVEMIAATDLYESARTAVRGLFQANEITIQATGMIDDVGVPRGKEAAVLRADLVSHQPRPGAWSVPVRVLVDGEPYRTVWIGLNVELYQELPVLLKDAPKGTQLNSKMFSIRRVRVTDHKAQPLALAMLTDAITVRAISAGHVVTERDVERPLAVTAGAPVWIEIVHGHIRASVLGSALQSGRMGDLITVRIDSTGKELQATVTGREQVTRELKRAR